MKTPPSHLAQPIEKARNRSTLKAERLHSLRVLLCIRQHEQLAVPFSQVSTI